jgi:hypothetical protein
MRLRPLLAVPLLLTGLAALPASASCGVSGVRGRDPGHAALNAEIDKAAYRRHVPPYLLKAIAWRESRWRQFSSDGHVVLSPSCAIGVMQVLARGFDASRLASDYTYNVDAGAQVLAAKMNESSANVPRSLGSDERRVTENWYRATYRYNGAGYGAMVYADAVFSSIASPDSEVRPWVVPVAVANPRNVIRGYTPQSGAAYVARLDGTWVSTLGTYKHGVMRGDVLAGYARAQAGKTLEGGQQTASIVVARNLGWSAWDPSRISLSTYPLGRASRLRHPSWIASTRPVRLGASTLPGADGRFTFPVQAANLSSSATVSEAFVPVLDGATSLLAHVASSWTLNPPHAPSASITSAPSYVTDASVDSTATIGLSYSDPSPGSGVAYVEVSRLSPGATAWASTRVLASSVRLALPGEGPHLVRVRAVDRAGHASAWTDPRKVVVPRDNTASSLTFSDGWETSSVGGSWLGSLASATDGSSVTTTVSGSSYAVIGTRGPGLAPLTVYLDDTLVTVIDPYADTTAQRQVLWQSPMTSGSHTLRLVVGDATVQGARSVTDSGALAYLDAIAVA